jgi:large subunit ribosomal protein L1
MDAKKIAENASVVLAEVMRKKPSDAKGDYLKSVALSSTMGPGVMITVKEN